MSVPEEGASSCMYKLVPVEKSFPADRQEPENRNSQPRTEDKPSHPDNAVDGCRSAMPVIFLHDHEAVVLGRCRLTQIRDLKLSRKQVRVEAKPDQGHVEVTQLGKLQDSSINGQPLVFPWSRIICPGDSLCLTGSDYEYKLERVDSKDVDQIPRRSILPRKRLITESFETDTATTTPVCISSPRGRKSQKTVRNSPYTPQQLVNQLDFLSSGKKSRHSQIAAEESEHNPSETVHSVAENPPHG